ncbi:hypothetical protein UlMin_041247 [Ulmus minor]
MDLSPSSSPTTKSTPETDSETPQQIQPPQPNGSLKPTQPSKSPLMAVAYRECLKNHAANIGGHAVDGCGEFMASPTAVLTDPTSLKCAACGCHRNFHRREVPDKLPTSKFQSFNRINHQLHHSPPIPPPAPMPQNRRSPSPSPSRSSSPGPSPSPHSPPPVSHFPPSSYFASPPQMLLSLSTGFSAPSSDEHHRNFDSKGENSSGRKRFRTKFSQQQKEKMCLFAEKLGWKMLRSEEKLIGDFCNEVGVSRDVLKVWMHNNKHTLGKKYRGSHDSNNSNNGDSEKIGFDSSNNKDEDRRANFNFFANGSSSSS